MSVLLSVTTIIFLILCILLIIIVLLQSDKGAGMGILGGSSQSAFGSSTADVITKITAVMIALFMIGSLGLAVMESSDSISREKKFFSDKDKGKGVEGINKSVSVERGDSEAADTAEKETADREVNTIKQKINNKESSGVNEKNPNNR